MTQCIVREKFDGNALTTVKDGKVMFSNLTLDQYIGKEPGLKLVSIDEFNTLHRKDDEKAKLIVESLNQPPIDIITSHLEGTLDAVHENDKVLWSDVKLALQSAFTNYSNVLRGTDEFYSKHHGK